VGSPITLKCGDWGLLLVSIGCYVSPFSLLVFIIISYLSGVVSFDPMGLGIRDVSFGSLLIFSGISVPSAAAITAIDRIIVSVIYLSGSVAATHFIGRQQDR